MRYVFSVILSLSLVGGAYAQAGNDPEQTIRKMLETRSFEGHDSKVLGFMGDEAAVVLTKVLAGRSLSQLDIDISLVIFDASFADPSMVENADDRQPRTALFVLKCLNASTTDPMVKKRIAETSQRIQEKYVKSKVTKSQE